MATDNDADAPSTSIAKGRDLYAKQHPTAIAPGPHTQPNRLPSLTGGADLFLRRNGGADQ